MGSVRIFLALSLTSKRPAMPAARHSQDAVKYHVVQQVGWSLVQDCSRLNSLIVWPVNLSKGTALQGSCVLHIQSVPVMTMQLA